MILLIFIWYLTIKVMFFLLEKSYVNPLKTRFQFKIFGCSLLYTLWRFFAKFSQRAHTYTIELVEATVKTVSARERFFSADPAGEFSRTSYFSRHLYHHHLLQPACSLPQFAPLDSIQLGLWLEGL